jgi:hypothetical protein
MTDAPEPERALPLPPRPEAGVLAPRLRPGEHRRELRRLEAERETAHRELGELVVEMSRTGALDPAQLADRSAEVRSLELQIATLTTALAGRRASPPSASTRRATILAALLAVAILGAVAGAWIERSRSDPGAIPVTVPTIVTETVTQPVAPAPAAVHVTTASAVTAHGGHAAPRAR